MGAMLSSQKIIQSGSRCYWNTLGVAQEVMVSTNCMVELTPVGFGSNSTKERGKGHNVTIAVRLWY